MIRRAVGLALTVVVAGAAIARAADRPAEEDLFGGAPSSTLAAASPTPSATAAEPATPRNITGTFGSGAPENPLAIGGLLYLREAGTVSRTQAAGDASLTTPILADVYGDARPNDRLRAMIRARMSYDASINPTATSFLNPVPYGGPSVALDQAWINFDVAHTAFVTAGRQHVKWGAARFWNPNDLLHTARRDALAQFDARTGETMVKVHVPWERRGWNFYAIQLFESLEHADRVGNVGGAARAEFVAGTAELGIDGLAQHGYKPRAGADLSMGLWDFDLYAEGVIQQGTDRPVWKEIDNPIPGGGVLLQPSIPDRLVGSAAGGLRYAFNVTDKEAVTLGAEYFYQGAGYTKKAIYPWLIYQGQFTPFYVARDYAAAYASMPVPGTNGNEAITVSNLANLSDKTAVVRIDWTAVVVTHMSFEAYAAGHYGAPGGEFRFGGDYPAQMVNGFPIPAVSIPAPLAEAGLGLRVSY